MALKQTIFESSQKTLVKEQQKRSFAILYKTIDYRPKIYKNSLKITSILDKEILFKNNSILVNENKTNDEKYYTRIKTKNNTTANTK